ncbi:MAG: RNA polymerase sigma factor [Oscillospiraceae bacterium]
MISAALAILETDEERNELSLIYESNIKTFYSVAFSKLHNVQDAEDAIQEAFLAVAKKPDVFFRIPANKRVSYINVIVRNIAFKVWNKKHRISENETELDENIFDERVSTEEKVLSDFACEQVLKFIDALPEGSKAAVHLKMNFGLKNKDIADILGISEEAAKKRVSRALNQIKQYMEDINNE